ncbi:putative blue pigment (indigoidine) exporter [Kitasatospora sp. GAS204A]|uniref:DMT family transporter n=1 Tax=unclassified Kitasatospora TaxID=2633591 RepID=UPI002473421F|nr:DMT family transporter [Kitasatospora sp. GAS204B]MDH6122304.1 putative blue pigment (indigoidine) exporter [Kitasatospora sp. GAS204B]
MSNQLSSQRLATTSAVTALAPLVWGSTYLITTEFLPSDKPLLASTLRALPAGLILLGFTRVLPKGIWWWRAVVLGVLNIGAFFYFLFLAAYHLPGGVAALVMSIQPMIVLLLGAVLLREKILPQHIVSCVLGAVGVALLVLEPKAGLDGIGVVAGLLGALCMASGIVLVKRWGRPEGVTVLTFTGWQLTVGGVLLLPITLATETLPDHLSWKNIGGFAYLGIIGALIAYALWFRGLARLPALAASFLSFASPLCATVLGYLFLHQSLRPLQLLGGVAVIGAVVIAQPRRGRAARPGAPQPATEPAAQPAPLQQSPTGGTTTPPVPTEGIR